MSGKQLKVGNQKISSFYGNAVARPYVVLKEDGTVDKSRVDQPKINDALIEWASKVPFGQGGTLLKPTYDGGPESAVPEARTDFQIFLMERHEEILAANPALVGNSDRKTLLAVGSTFWCDNLTPEERKAYKERAAEEKKAVAARVAELETSDPKFKTFREQMQKYKRSVGNILSAAKAQAGPLWKLQRLANAQYKKLAATEAEAEEEEEEPEAQASKKKAGKGKGAKKGKQQRRRQEESEGEDGSQDSEEEAAATSAMAELQLKSSRKERAPARKAGGSSKKAAPTQTKTVQAAKGQAGTGGSRKGYDKLQVEDIGEKEEGAALEANQQQRKAAGRNGAAMLAQRLTRSRGSQLYDGEYDLPSQNPTPAKAGKGAARESPSAGAPTGAALPAKSPGKRLRGRGAAEEEEQPAASPTKRLRSSSRRR